MNKPLIFDDAALLYENAAGKIVELSKNAIFKNGRFTLALSGGNTPRKLYELLAKIPYRDLIDWKNVFIFWGDERCVPAADKDNNSNMAFKALLNHVPIPAENVFPVPVESEPGVAAKAYEKTIQLFFKELIPSFDLILLGLGDNGHTASLFPHTDILKEREHIVKEVFVNELDAWRISFTVSLINNAASILFLVSGEDKAAVIKTVFSGEENTDHYPVQLIKPIRGTVDWYLDKAAASLIAGLT